jgi:hypothetical protein
VPKLKIEGVPPYDGDYNLDIAAFTGTELHTIKEISGVRAGELQEGLQAGDYDLVVAFTVIVLQRAGRDVDPAEIMAATVGAITVDLQTEIEVVDERPPASPGPNGMTGGEPNGSGGAESKSSLSETSGSPSTDAGDQPANRPEAIGSPS